MHKRHKYDLIVLLAFLGFGVCVYLMAFEFLNAAVPCTITHGCNEVLQSRYANFLNVPLPIWGIAFYFGVTFSALMANRYAKWKKVLTGLLSAGALAALAFLYIQFFVLGKICQYCLATDLLAVALLMLDLNIEHQL